MSENDLIINESFPDIQSASSLLNEASTLNRTFSELNLLDGESNASEIPRTANAETMTQFFNSIGHMGKEKSNDCLHDDLELNLQSDELRISRFLIESDWRAHRPTIGEFSFSQVDYMEYDPLVSDAELRPSVSDEIHQDDSDQQIRLTNDYLKKEEPVDSSSTSGQTLHSVLVKLKSASSRPQASNFLNVDYNNSALVGDLTSVILKMSENRSPMNFFVWVVREKNNQELFCVNVIDENSRKLLGTVCINDEQFKKAQADGVFEKFLSVLLIDSIDTTCENEDR